MHAEELFSLRFQTLCVGALFGSQSPELNEGHASRNVFPLSFHQPGEFLPASTSVAGANFLRDYSVLTIDGSASHCFQGFHISDCCETVNRGVDVGTRSLATLLDPRETIRFHDAGTTLY